MADQRKVTFEHAATLDELAGVGKNPRFDRMVDNRDDEEFQVICRKGEEEIPLAKPSRAFYFGDRGLYDEEAARFDKETKDELLCAAQFRRNGHAFTALKKAVTTGFVIPFVGAGMSVSAGLPSWTNYLLQLCGDANLETLTLVAVCFFWPLPRRGRHTGRNLSGTMHFSQFHSVPSQRSSNSAGLCGNP